MTIPVSALAALALVVLGALTFRQATGALRGQVLPMAFLAAVVAGLWFFTNVPELLSIR